MEWRKWRRSSYSVIFFFCCCSLLSLFYLTALLSGHHSRTHKGVDSLMMEYSYSQSQVARTSRRRSALAGGPGSYPPRCAGKCGDCAPCLPVHVAVPPGGSSSPVTTTEYYPEAWRCKCGNKLYMP